MKRITIAVTFIFFSIWCSAQSWQDTLALIDKIMERYKPENPGCQLAISRNGVIIFSKAYGMADLEHGVSLTKESLIEAGSVSKQFTAAAILLLEQQGKLSLNDDVRKYVPELRDYGTTITLRHIMQHSSGLKDWGSIGSIAGWPRGTKTYSNDDALYIISRQKTLNHLPGDEYVYSNSNYNILAVIVERVSGKTLAEFSRIYLFEPAGMKHTEWRDNYKKVVPNRAIAYGKNDRTYFTDMPNEHAYGNGGLLTTVEDLLTWNNYYFSGKLGNPSLLSKQLATSYFNNGRVGQYGAGLRVDSIRGWKSITHGGATAGYRANLAYFPDLGLSIAWLSNTSEFDQGSNPPDVVVRNLLVKNLSIPPVSTNQMSYEVSIEKLNSYAGWYRDTRDGNAVKLFIKDGKLANSRGGNLLPIAENVFMLGPNRLEIYPGKPGKLFLINSADTIKWVAADSSNTDSKSLNEYSGEYYSDEAEVSFKIVVKEGKLFAHRNPKTDYLLTPIYRDGFNFPEGNIIFSRNSKKKIQGMSIYVGRARNIEFKKIK